MNFLKSPSLKIVLLFFACNIIALLYMFSVLELKEKHLDVYSNIIVEEKPTQEPILAVFIVVSMILFSFLNLFLIKWFKTKIILALVEKIAIFVSIFLFVFPFLFLQIQYLAFLVSFLIAIIFLFIKRFAAFRNLIAIIMFATTSTIFAFSLGIDVLLIIGILLSIYDYLATFKTKHMLDLAKTVAKDRLIFAIYAQPDQSELLPKNYAQKNISSSEGFENKPKAQGAMLLGGGDIFMAVSLAIASALEIDLISFAFVALFNVIAIFLIIYFVSKKKVALAALPPIVFSSALAILIRIFLKFV
jgi:presenilin-like A22 family membrane protease